MFRTFMERFFDLFIAIDKKTEITSRTIRPCISYVKFNFRRTILFATNFKNQC